MTTIEQGNDKLVSSADLDKIPGFETAFDSYASTMAECMAEITASVKQAPKHKGVPPVRAVIDKYEETLTHQYSVLLELYLEHNE